MQFVVLGRELKGQPPGHLCWVPLPCHRCYFSWLEHSLWHQLWGNAISLPSGWLPGDPPCVAHGLWRVSPLCMGVEVWEDSGGVSEWMVRLWGRGHYPHFPMNLSGAFSSGNPLAPTSEAQKSYPPKVWTASRTDQLMWLWAGGHSPVLSWPLTFTSPL